VQVHRAQLDELFPAAQPQDSYHELVQHRMTHLGFTAANTIACVGVCRDELTSSFVDGVQRLWGEAFHLGSLAGMAFLGRTGLAAAISHAPAGFERERFLFFALAHLGLGEDGEVGMCVRPGQNTPTPACGALIAFRNELLSGQVSLELDPEDLELSLLRRRLYPRLVDRPVPSLAELTGLTLEVILEDLERGIALTVDPHRADYAVFTGIQIHAPGGHLVWPGNSYAVIAGRRQSLTLAEP
jgi:hypothetical protein